MCASPGHATLLLEQPFIRGNVIDNRRSIIDESFSILIKRRASSSPENGESSSRDEALPQVVRMSLTGITPVITPGDAHDTTTRAAPDVPHHEIASTRPNPSVEDTFDNTHATGASGTHPQTTCVEFIYTERDPFRISKEEK